MSERSDPPKSVQLRAGGARIAVELPTVSLGEAVQVAWADCLDDTTPRAPDVVIEIRYGDRAIPSDQFTSRLVLSGPSDEVILHDLSQAVTVAMLGHLRGHRLLLHAAAVSDEHGNALAFVGRSGAGKTTLSRTLAPHFGYLSDETVILDRELALTAYPKPLSIVSGPGLKRQVAVSALGGRVARGVARLGGVWLLDRDPHAGAPTLAPIAPIDALPRLAEQSSWIDVNERPLAWLAAAARAGAGAHVVRYSEAADLVPLVRTWLEARHVG